MFSFPIVAHLGAKNGEHALINKLTKSEWQDPLEVPLTYVDMKSKWTSRSFVFDLGIRKLGMDF